MVPISPYSGPDIGWIYIETGHLGLTQKEKRMTEQIDPAALIMAAGGIVEKQTDEGPLIAVIHRHLYGDEWSLPKGKQDSGETLQETAIREVLEETCCMARIIRFAGVTHYFHGSLPKVVLYWHMKLETENKFNSSQEVSDMEWLTPVDALQRLNYHDERQVLKKIYPLEVIADD